MKTWAACAAAAIASTLVVLCACPREASGQEPPPPQEHVIVPPRLISSITAPYPAGAEGDASVLLAVSVGATGNVDDVRVLEGVEPFATAAIESMKNARFVPASRDGNAIAATVKFRVDFTKPKMAEPPPAPETEEPPKEPEPEKDVEPSAPSEPSAPGVATSPPPPRKPERVNDVVVRGGKSAVGANGAESLARAEVRQLPGAFGDPFRAIEAVPGMTPVLTGLPYFYVRGAPPANVGYFFDGVRVPYLFHFGLGPAVIHPALIAKTDLHRGGYPAALGRYAGGIVDATAMPPAERLHAEGQLRLIDAGALVEMPFANGKGSALAAGRYSYTAALFSLLSSDTTLDYRDYQARVAYSWDDKNTVSILGFGAYDFASQRETIDPNTQPIFVDPGASREPRDIDRVLFASEFHRVDLRWDRTLPNSGHLRVAGTFGYDRTRVEARRAASDVMTAARVELTQPLSRDVLLRAGTDVIVDQYAADSLPAFADDDDVVLRQRAIFVDRVDFATGARADAVLTMIPRMEVVPGVRLDVYGSGDARAVAVDPRFAARFFINDKLRIVHAYGVASQPPSTPIALPAISLGLLRGGLQRAVQTSAAVEADLPQDFTATAGVFHNAFYGLNDALGTAQVELIDIERSDTLLSKSRGDSYGVELGVRRKLTRRVAGLASYTFSRSNRSANGVSFISGYDRPHVLTTALSVDLTRGWRAGLRFVTYSGIPQSPSAPAFSAQVTGAPPARTPAFYRVDARVEKRWTVGKHGYVSLIIEALNATLSHEVTGYSCGTAIQFPGAARPSPQCAERVIGPVTVPSIGVEGGF